MLRAINGEHLNYSDRRLKTKIEAMPSLLNKFMQLQPVTYQMKYHNANHEKTIGFIAQDVKQLFPELVCIITDTSRSYQGITDLHGVNYNGFHVLTIKAIQEQQQLIKKMQEQNEGTNFSCARVLCPNRNELAGMRGQFIVTPRPPAPLAAGN